MMLHQVEANLAALIESTKDLIWSVDLDFRLITFNRALRENIERNFGNQLEAGMRSQEFLPPEIAQCWPDFYRRALKEGPYRTEYSLIDARTLELAFNPIIVDGITTGISVFGKDITEWKAAEHRHLNAEKRYRDILENALEGFYRTTPDGESESANPAFATMLGYDSPEELIAAIKNTSRNLWVDPEDRERFKRQLDGQGFLRGFECQFKRKDGNEIWVSLNARRVCDADGRAPHYEGFIQDITKRRLSEELLRKREESLRESQEIAELGSYDMDIRTGLWEGSEVLHQLFGIDSAYICDVEGWAALVHPDDRERMSAYFTDEVVAKGWAFDKEYRIVRQTDQAVRWVHGMGRLEFDAQGKPVKMRGIIKDITERRLKEIELRDSEERYRATFEQAAVGIVHASFEGRILRCNARFSELLGYPAEEILGMTIGQMTLPEDMPETGKALKRIQDGASSSESIEKRYLRKDGGVIWAKVTVSIQRDGAERPLHFVAIMEDINARKSAEKNLATAAKALQKSEERYRTAFQTSLDSININRLSDGQYIDVNQAFLELMGYEREEVVGRTSQELNIWEDIRDRHAMVAMLSRNPSFRGSEVQFKKKNGEVIWGEISASLMEIDGVPCILSVTRDISSAKAAENQIRNLSFYDPLTGLPNRRLLLERLRQSLTPGVQSNHKQALLLINLDNFKTLNDTLGHQTGDLLLQEVARRIAACVYEAHTVCRLGGDEFVVMLDELSEVAEEAATQAKAAGERILAALSHSYLIQERECLSAASIGITIFSEQGGRAEEILQQADIALDHAKTAGRNTLRFFSPDLQEAINAHAELEESLRAAIKAKQFLLYYQPQIERGRLTGVEALVRWMHPRRGMVAPDEFISLAEESGLILPLGDWVLETACKQIAAWADQVETAHLVVAVNISALQFRQPGFVDDLLAILHYTGANPHNLKLELTESMLVENIEEVIAKMGELKSHGLSFSLDDFGTGYSSLAYLKRLPLDQLKIDRAFVHDMLEDATSGAIAQTIISLGRAMNLSVVAEGVENEGQRGFLAGLGCHSYQGNLFSPPLPLDEFLLLLPAYAD